MCPPCPAGSDATFMSAKEEGDDEYTTVFKGCVENLQRILEWRHRHAARLRAAATVAFIHSKVQSGLHDMLSVLTMDTTVKRAY